jgi:hypothetical protein
MIYSVSDYCSTGGNMSDRQRKAKLEEELGLKRHTRWLFYLGLFVLVILGSLVCVEIFLKDESQVTEGLAPRQVVELFYTAVNTLDTYTITHSIDTGNITPFHSRIVMNTLTGKVSHIQDVTHVNPLVGSDYIVYNPPEWFEKGQPELASGERVMGILNLEIRKINKHQFEVTYDYYLTGIPEEGEEVRPFVTRCVDVCMLDRKDGSWFIVEIEQVSETDISLEQSADRAAGEKQLAD